MRHPYSFLSLIVAIFAGLFALPAATSAQAFTARLPSLPAWVEVDQPFEIEAILEGAQEPIQQAGIDILVSGTRRGVTSYSITTDRFLFSNLSLLLTCQARTNQLLENEYFKLDCIRSHAIAGTGNLRIVWNLAFKPGLAGSDVTIKLGARTTVSAFASGTIKVVAGGEPVCRAGGPYTIPCGAGGRSATLLTAAGSSDPLGGPLSYAWTTSCSGGSISNGDSITPSLTLDRDVLATETCDAKLIVTNSAGLSTLCASKVTIQACSGGCDGRGGVFDQCRVCGGDGKSCLDCAEVPFGSKQTDKCGICGGNNECIECGNISVKDACGVCGGDGTSCRDCRGIPFGQAKSDRCGVCGGDGLSCLNCSDKPVVKKLLSTLLSPTLVSLLRKQNSALLSFAAFHSDLPRLETASSVRLARAQKAQRRIDTELRRLPSPFRSCTNKNFCRSTNYSPVLTEVRKQLETMRASVAATLRALKDVGGNAAPGTRKLKTVAAEKFKALTDMPREHSTCN